MGRRINPERTMTVKEIQHRYYMKHKERYKKKYVCECGVEIVASYKKRHEQTLKHRLLLIAKHN